MAQQVLEVNERDVREIQSPDPNNAPTPKKRRLTIDFTRFLAMPLGKTLLGTELTASLYAKIGFRFIGASACIEREQLEIELQKFRNIYRLSPASALHSSIQVGYEKHVPLDDVQEYLSKLHDPRHRIVCELFWPHVDDKTFTLLKTEKHIASPTIVEAFEKILKQSNGKQDTIFIKHSLALSYHNLAIANEFAYTQGAIEWNDDLWLYALLYWKEVHESDFFWDYLRKRAEHSDDPRLQPEDVELLREKLPAVLLGFNTLFARAYATAHEVQASADHISLIRLCDFPASNKQEILTSLMKTLTRARLEPLIQRVETEILNVPGRYSRKKFEKVCEPVLEQASAVRDYLLKELQLPEEMVEMAEFDRLCEVITTGCDTKINYDTDDRVRDILYVLLVHKKMLKLPLSSMMRNKLEQAMRSDTEILYGDFMPSSKKLDPTACWFAADEEADPDQSILLPIHKITHREVQVDRFQGSAGVSVKYNYRDILIPRSQYAAEQHPKYSRRKKKKPVEITNKKAHTWARVFAFLAGFTNSGWSVLYPLRLLNPGFLSMGLFWNLLVNIGIVLLLRRIILHHIDERGDALPVGGLCILGISSFFLIVTFLSPTVTSVEIWQTFNVLWDVLGIGSLIGFGRAAHLAFKKLEDKIPALQPKPAEVAVQKKQVKPHSNAKKFPAYKNAKAAGYKDGKKPTSAEMQMTYAEEQEARRRLGGGYYY